MNQKIVRNNKQYAIIKKEPYEFHKKIGCHHEDLHFEIITYLERNGNLYITTHPDYNLILPIRNTDHIRGFSIHYNYTKNKEAKHMSLKRFAEGDYNQQPYYKVNVHFRHQPFYHFVSKSLTFGAVYCSCKYFFDALYPEGYDYKDKSLPVDFQGGADTLNNIKHWFGKKSTRIYVDEEYCRLKYSNRRDMVYMDNLEKTHMEWLKDNGII